MISTTSGDQTAHASPDQLARAICERSAQALSPAAQAVADHLCALYPGCALLFYGSGNSVASTDDPTSLMYDFYVIGESYEALFQKRWLRTANRLIPPNVFYLETPSSFGVLRSKYAVLSLAHFERLVSEKTFHSYFWARFAQPCRIIDPSEAMTERLRNALAAAVTTFCRASSALVAPAFTADGLWLAGLNASYKAELRAENTERAQKLIKSYGDWTALATGGALKRAYGGAVSIDADRFTLSQHAPRWRCETAWRARAIFGAFLSIIRLLKGTQTFVGGIEYIVWKIERHSGVSVPLSDWEKSHPMLAAPRVALRYYRMKRQQNA